MLTQVSHRGARHRSLALALLGSLMTMGVVVTDNTVVRKTAFLTNARAKALASQGVRLAVDRHGKNRVADAADVQVRTVEKWLSETSCPSLPDLVNVATIEPRCFDAVLAEMGWAGLRPAQGEATDDAQLLAQIGQMLAEYLDRMRDGHRCHVDTRVLAGLFRQIIPQMQAIVDEDDALRSG